jgi:hypothetical protein
MVAAEDLVEVAVEVMLLEDQTHQTGMAQEELHLRVVMEDLVEMVQMLVAVVAQVPQEALE